MSSQLETALNTLLEEPRVDIHLIECKETPASSEAPPIVILFPRFREDEPDIEGLAEFLWLQAVNYVIPLRLRRRAKEEAAASTTGGDLSYAARLLQRTRRTFLEFNKKYPYRASEVGELLAYLVALQYLQAVQIASKMALKTNGNMPVHGLDGIHAQFSNGIMKLFFLESKLANSADAGAKKYAESVNGFGSNRKQYLLEYDIISDLSNLDSLPEQDRNAALEYLDVYGSKRGQRLERAVGVICYSDTSLYSAKLPKNDRTPPSSHELALYERLSKQYHFLRELSATALKTGGVDLSTCKVFFIAFPDVDVLRATFYEVMNG